MHADFVAALHASGWQGTQERCTRGPVTLVLGRASFRTDVHLLYVEPADRGYGHARQALTHIVQAADTTRTLLVLAVQPHGKDGLNTHALIALYARFGFAHIGTNTQGQPLMARHPHPQDIPS